MKKRSLYERILNYLIKHYGTKLNDSLFLRMRYRLVFGRRLNLKHPRSFNEKIQWLKLHDRNPVYHEMADKYFVRHYIEKKVGSEYVIPIIGHWENADEIDLDLLPNEFVIKCTHDSQSVRICKDKGTFDFEGMKRDFSKALQVDYSIYGREWSYMGIKPSIIAEELLTDESGVELKDYKFFCFNGEPRIIQIDYDRFTDHKRRLFDTKWNKLDVRITYKDDPDMVIQKPEKLDEMIEVCRKISTDIPFLRVDLYYTGKVYIGELTFYPGAGFEPIEPYSVDEMWGYWLTLPCN